MKSYDDISATGEMTGSRKRSRSEEDEADDCVPISKRINRLQIRSRDCSTEALDQQQFNNNDQGGECCPFQQQQMWQSGGAMSAGHAVAGGSGHMAQQQCAHDIQTVNGGGLGAQAGCSSGFQPGMASMHPNHQPHPQDHPHNMHHPDYGPELKKGYNPELTAKQNPHYFQSNQVLFNAHAERHKRIAHNGYL